MYFNSSLNTPIDIIGNAMVDAGFATNSEVCSVNAIFGYAKRDGFLGSIATLLHRVWNAIKAIFGQSDWQKASSALISITNRLADKITGNDPAWSNALQFKMFFRDPVHIEIDEELKGVVDIINHIKKNENFYSSVFDRVNVLDTEPQMTIHAMLSDSNIDALVEKYKECYEEVAQEYIAGGYELP
jgi:hypothetical protein